MESGGPSVSIVMPAFNSDRWLTQAIESIQAQSLSNFELIIVDDGSTDKTSQVAAAAAREDLRIRTARQDHLGIASALNHGISLAHAPFVARMDADDIAAPDRLQTQLAFLGARPRVAAVGSWACVVDELGHKIGELTPAADSNALQNLLPKQNPFVHSSVMLRMDAIREMGGYRPVLDGAEDYDLWLRISERWLLANIPQFLLSYRLHPRSPNAAAVRRQLLSARLARLAATARRESRPDFVETLKAPLDLAALQSKDELRVTADLYLLLGQPADGRFTSRSLGTLGRAELSHAERKTAQFWLKELLAKQTSWFTQSIVLFWLLRLHPPRGLLLLWSALRGR